MDFTLDDDQALLVQTVRRFADRDLRGWAADADRAAAPPAQLLPAATELGLLVDAVPADHGGMLEGDPARYDHLARALRGLELGRGCAALAALLETNVEPALAVARWGSAAAQAALFPALAAGGLATTAYDHRGALTLIADGDGLRLTGTLGPLPALAVAGHVLLITDQALALVPTTGLAITAMAPSGWRAARWATATAEAHPIPAALILARGPAAAAAGREVLSWYRASLAARAVGVSHAAMEHAAAYAQDRVQFGRPIGAFESIRRLRDDATTLTAAARLLTLNAAWAVTNQTPAAADLASRARVLAGDVVARATIDAVQIYGGYGFVNDYPVEKLMRDARAFEALLGDERLDRVLSNPPA